MKRLLVELSSAVFLFATASALSAQGTGSVHVGISGGADFPVQDQKDAYKTGWNGTLLIPINFGSSPVSVRLDGSYHRMDTKSGLAAFTGSGNVRILSGTVDLVVGPRGTPVEPYAIGGVGAYDMRFRGEDLSNNTFSDTTTRFGWNAGGGIAFPLGAGATNSRFFVEARYTSVSTNGDRFSDSVRTGGTRFTFVPLNVGFIF
jgi:Outer membrane protein beta-barrel domain